ncbi:MAG: adenylate/guanylate cyclase domain-containing protein [Candidatus Eremiobacteraeota bacterium]|nr:adenylate/guanylate cyclase domain-containing protein [Candidatus Eremiobacteraeota bacterium]
MFVNLYRVKPSIDSNQRAMPGVAKPTKKAQNSVPLPTGMVTFLFSDIEGSTQRWEQHRDEMDAAVRRHDSVMRAAIEQHSGYVFKTVGDEFCAAFPTVFGAINAAVAAQRALNREDFAGVDGLRVRMGLTIGDAFERDGDYFGPTVNRVARLMSIGHGGQVLVSSVVEERLEGALGDGLSLVDLGLRRLRDLTQPEHVWQLNIAGLPSQFPPLNSLDARPNNLPVQVSALIGRERDLDDVKALIGKHRCVTITGSGGIGKTRVALQAGADLIDRYPDGVWFADLAPITDPELIASVVATAVGMAQVGGRRVDEAVPHWLKRKQLLLILDNCEHELGAVAPLADAIHRTAPHVRILATSRQALDISGEAAYRLPSLAVPVSGSRVGVDEALQYGAVAVFVDRATHADTRFVLTGDNAPIVADICRRLDGIPLAIELAAARVNVLSIPDLAQRLNERFKILTGGSRTALPRHKTLTALIDWSYDLLTPQEQKLFQQLGIFPGGFGLEAATNVCGVEADEIDTMDILASLTDKSLVIADTLGHHKRYHLLESTRAYALQKLASSERERLARRHAEHYAEKAKDADNRYGAGSQFAWLADVGLELDNYRAALEWGLTQGHDAILGGVIAGSLGSFWLGQGLMVEGRYWVESALERVNASEQPRTFARLLRAQASFCSGNNMYEAAARAVVLYESISDRHGAARSNYNVAYGLSQMGRSDEAMKAVTQALAVMQECNDNHGIANCLDMQAAITMEREKRTEARDLRAHALAMYKALGNEIDIAVSLANLAELEFADGHREAAFSAASEALAIQQRRGVDSIQLAICNINGAAYHFAVGDPDGARASAREGLRVARQVESAVCIETALQHLALGMALERQPHDAARLLGYVNAVLRATGIGRESTEKWGYDRLMSVLRAQLSDIEIEKLAAEGAAWSEDQAVEEALKM